MAKFKGTVELIGGLTPKNNGKFPLVAAKDIQVDDNGTRLDQKLQELSTGSGGSGDNSVVVVEILDLDGVATASHSASEIFALVQSGKVVVALVNGDICYRYSKTEITEDGGKTSHFVAVVVSEQGDAMTAYGIAIDESKDVVMRSTNLTNCDCDMQTMQEMLEGFDCDPGSVKTYVDSVVNTVTIDAYDVASLDSNEIYKLIQAGRMVLVVMNNKAYCYNNAASFMAGGECSSVEFTCTEVDESGVVKTTIVEIDDGANVSVRKNESTAAESGGHYTPSIKDNENGTMTVTFAASKEGMPDINPVTVTIPKGKDGGHYSPSIHTITENSFKISFTPSNSDMPVVEDVTITLPTAEDGVGIESIVQTTTSNEDGGENVITITLTNGNKSTFKIKNGSKGSKGDAGKGISKVEKTSTSGLSDTYTITYTDGSTSTYTVMNGDKGDAGIGIKSILQTTTSSADGGENVVTVTLTDDTQSTFKFKNGSKGNAGNGIKSIAKTSTSGLVDTYTITFTDNTTATFTVTNGKAGTSVTISSVTESTESGGSNVVEFSDGKSITIKNGKDGKDYILTDDDKTEIIQEILAELGAAVIGYIDGNTITVKGNLAEGTYTAYYEVDGELVEIGELTLAESGETPEPTTYTVTFMADGVTVDAVEYQEGDTALERVPDVPAKDGYTGVWETYDISNGGNITVNAVYTQIPVTPTYTNLFTAGTAKLNTRIAGTGELKTDTNATGKVTTDFITIPSDKLPFEATTKIYIKGATFTADGNTKIATYQAATGTDYSAMYSGLNGSSISTVDEGNGVISVSGLTNSFPASVKRMAFTLKVKDTAITADDVAGIIITIDEPITDSTTASPKDFADPADTYWWNDAYLSSAGEKRDASAGGGLAVTNYIGPLEKGDIVYIDGMEMKGTSVNYRCAPYNANKAVTNSGIAPLSNWGGSIATDLTITDTTAQFTNASDTIQYWRFGGVLVDGADKVVINIKRDGEWLTE